MMAGALDGVVEPGRTRFDPGTVCPGTQARPAQPAPNSSPKRRNHGGISEKVKDIMAEFDDAANNPLVTARQWQMRTHGQVAGCMGLFVPEEIIHAAGMLPVVVLERDAPIVRANAHVQNFMCGYIRSVVDQALSGDYNFLTCLAISDCCHVVRMLGDLMRNIAVDIGTIEFLFFPVTARNPRSWQYLLDELSSFTSRMEAIAGKTISQQDILASIKIYNNNRQLLQRLYKLRRGKPGLLSSMAVINIVKSSMVLPKEEHSALLERLIGELSAVEIEPDAGRIPVVVSGSLCETCDAHVLAALEESGGVVVDDDLYVGSRYFNTLVNEEKPPLEALAYAYVNRVAPCPTRYDPQNDLGEYLVQMVKDSNARGVVNIIVKYCEAHYYSYLSIRRRLAEYGVPEYMIETEHEFVPTGQVKTRIQAFLESLQA